MTEESIPSGENNNLHPVRIRQLRFVYRDLIASSSAGEGIYKVLSDIAPVLRVDLFTIAWTGNPASPVVLRRDACFDNGNSPRCQPGESWFHFHSESLVVQIIDQESKAYYPDATRNYSCIREFGHDSWKLVIGNRMIGIAFDRNDPLARLDSQIFSFLDVISQALLDFNRRQLRHFQDQYIMAEAEEDSAYKSNDIDNQVASFIEGDDQGEELALVLLRKNAEILENFFGFTYIEYLLSPDIASVLFYHSSLENTEFEDHPYKLVRITLGEYKSDGEFDPNAHSMLEFPLGWGLGNEENQFCMRLFSRHEINPHVRRELLLNQALLKGKTEIEALFDRRYRELRIAQDVAHFRRCRSARMDQKSFQQIREHLLNSVPDYGVLPRRIERQRIFPEYADWSDGLSQVFVDINADILEFQSQVHMSDIREFKYLTIRAPQSLRDILLETLHPRVFLHVSSSFSVLERYSDPGIDELEAENYIEKLVFFNDAASVSVIYPCDLYFQFQRIKEMFEEYLESIGEGIARLFTLINPNSGIANRSALTARLEYLIPQVQYSDQVRMDVSSLDIVSFKIFNELFGHPFGDRVIHYVAQQLDACLPETAFHMSGDEYYAVMCWYNHVDKEWVSDFFRDRGVYSEADFRAGRKRLDAFVKGVPVYVPLSDVSPVLPSVNHPIGSYQLVQLIANFFTHDAEGRIGLKKYSRSGNDYHSVIWDPQRRIQILVDEAWEALMDGKIKLDHDSFRSFILNQSSVGDKLFILPRLTIGTEQYNLSTVLPYASDIIDAADAAAGRRKK